MPGSLRYATLSAGTVGFQRSGGLAPLFAENDARWDSRYNFQSRGPKTWRDRNWFVGAWPRGGWVGGGALGLDYTLLGDGGAERAQYEPYSCDGAGTQSRNAIRGTTVDASDVAVANAIVQGFVTATDAFVGEVQSGLDGTYTLMTEQLKTTAHYLVAYKAGSPDIAGTTVNTLLPTNVDGT